jgi:hypothetical protein
MSSISILGDTSGSVLLQAPSIAGSTTLNLPAKTGTVMVSGNMPAFSYYANAGQTLSTGAKILFGAQEFDTASAVSSSTFQPTIAGYYQINAQLQPNNSYCGGWICIYKNGSPYKYGNFCVSTSFGGWTVASLVYLNGSTDYIEIWGNFQTSQPVASGPYFSYFNGCMLRNA